MNLSLQDFPVLENLAFRIPEVGTNDVDLTGILDSISSFRFSAVALNVSARERRCVESGGAYLRRFFEEMKALDWPLSRLAARTLCRTGRRTTLVLLANNTAAVAETLTEFQKVGNTWKGEKVFGSGGRGNYWSFIAAKDCQLEGQSPDDSVISSINI